jgi:hypothetical protein
MAENVLKRIGELYDVEDKVWGSVTSFHFSGVDRMLPSGYPSPSG